MILICLVKYKNELVHLPFEYMLDCISRKKIASSDHLEIRTDIYGKRPSCIITTVVKWKNREGER